MKILIASFFFVTCAYAADSLESKLDSLHIPENQVSPVVSQDELYTVNQRYSSLINRHEISMFGANNFTVDSHLTSQSYGLTYRYHLNDNWNFGIKYSKYNNELSDAGEKLFKEKAILPDTDYATDSYDASVAYNLFYGKIRFTKKTVVYFDQYISLGYGQINLASGSSSLMLGDLGVAFWLGQHFSSRLGVRNEFYKQQKLSGTDSVYNAIGYVEFGYLFGEGTRI